MNQYSIEFFAKCPSNDVRIKYSLVINTNALVMVEGILKVVEANTLQPVYHEKLADAFAVLLPGLQVMTAHHHGVDIETTRNGDCLATTGEITA